MHRVGMQWVTLLRRGTLERGGNEVVSKAVAHAIRAGDSAPTETFSRPAREREKQLLHFVVDVSTFFQELF